MLGSVGANLNSYLLTLFLSYKAENQPKQQLSATSFTELLYIKTSEQN